MGMIIDIIQLKTPVRYKFHHCLTLSSKFVYDKHSILFNCINIYLSIPNYSHIIQVCEETTNLSNSLRCCFFFSKKTVIFGTKAKTHYVLLVVHTMNGLKLCVLLLKIFQKVLLTHYSFHWYNDLLYTFDLKCHAVVLLSETSYFLSYCFLW